MVIQIAKAELRSLFYSPVAWFLAIVFMVQCGYFFIEGLYVLARNQEVMADSSPDFKDWGPVPLTWLFFMAPGSAYTIVLKNIYLFVPLLTMGLIGREVHTNTIKLLFSSPVKLRQVVGGKFLAIMVYNMLLLLILGIFLITFGFSVKSADAGLLVCGALAFYLLICTYTSIGLFMSSLTNYQILAAIGTFLIIFILSRIDGLWQKIDFVRDLTFFLHLPGRTERMLKGLLVSKDLLYFILVVGMFLGFTLIRLKKQRESKPWYVTLFRVMMVVGITLCAGYIFSRPQTTIYFDTTAIQGNTIHPKTQAILKEMKDGPLEVTLYINLLGGEAKFGFPSMRNIYRSKLWEQYQRFKTDIHFKYVYYYHYEDSMDMGALRRKFPGKNNEEMARDMAKGYQVKLKDFPPLSAVKDMINLKPEGYRLVMQLKYKGRTEMLRTYPAPGNDARASERAFPNEENVAATLKRLLRPESIPTILFTSGNLERDPYKMGEREYSRSTIAKSEKEGPANLGFKIDTISLDTRDIPAGLTALAIADPRREFSAVARQKIEKYIDEGGNIIVMGEPGKQPVLNPLLEKLGVEMLDGNLVQPSFHEMPHMVNPYYTEASTELADESVLRRVKRLLAHKKDRDTMKILMPGVAALSYVDSSKFVKKPAMLTSGLSSWLKKGRLVVDSAAVVYSPHEGDIKAAFPTVLQLSRQVGQKQQRAVVYGDADFVSNLRVQNGRAISRAVFSWVTGNEYPVYLSRPDPNDNLVLIASPTVKVLKVIYVWVLPTLLLIAGTVILVRRKRQ